MAQDSSIPAPQFGTVLLATIYDLETGELGRTVQTNDPSQIAVQLETGAELWVPGHWDAATHRVVDGVVVTKPALLPDLAGEHQ